MKWLIYIQQVFLGKMQSLPGATHTHVSPWHFGIYTPKS